MKKFLHVQELLQIPTNYEVGLKALRELTEKWLEGIEGLMITRRKEGYINAEVEFPEFASGKTGDFLLIVCEILKPLGYKVTSSGNAIFINWNVLPKVWVNSSYSMV
jgi:hypothetical protein